MVLGDMAIKDKEAEEGMEPIQSLEAQTPRCVGMVKGEGEGSYVRNSHWQRVMTANSFKFLNDSLERMPLPRARTVVICDLGCASSPNAFINMQNIVDLLQRRYKTMSDDVQVMPEFQVFLNDLPINDFNTLFKFLPVGSKTFHTAVIPGSFFDRLTPLSSVHIFQSTHCIHHMTKVPAGLTVKKSPAYNGERMWVEGNKVEVIEAYKQDAIDHMTRFLDARAAELVSGGLLLTVFGIKQQVHGVSALGDWLRPLEEDDISTPFSAFRILQYAWNEMIAEGLLTKEQLATYNFPFYTLTVVELREEVLNNYKEIFAIEALEEVTTSLIQDPPLPDEHFVHDFFKTVKAAFGPPTGVHLGESKNSLLFQRAEAIALEKVRRSGAASILPWLCNNVMVLRRL